MYCVPHQKRIKTLKLLGGCQQQQWQEQKNKLIVPPLTFKSIIYVLFAIKHK